MTSGKSNPNNPANTANTTKTANTSGGGPGGGGTGGPGGGGTGAQGGGGIGGPRGAVTGNGGVVGPAGRPVTPERFVVQVPGAAALSSAAGEKKVDDLFKQFFGGKKLKPIEMVDTMRQKVQARKVEGRTTPEFEITQRPLSGTSGGPTTGQSVAQTSLSERANAALVDAEKRLDALKPMKTPTDPENLDALRTVTLTTYKRLVGELGFGGGLRGTRVERHFDVLIGVQPQTGPIDLQAKSLLKKIEEAFSLKVGAEVNTTEDSANLANFRIVKENLFDIYRGWTGFKKEVENDFSELTGKLSRKLAVLDNEVTDVETAMDEVGYDANDRESDVIESDITSPKMTIGGLLLWIREFASEEGPELIEGGGALGIEAAIPTLTQLGSLVAALVASPPIDDNNVKASLESLNNHLAKATALAKQITGQT